ncbi:MAG: hypothetical protein E6165_06950, partial [Varibaculum cambriense]|nr:hypothetical protein [Varibaculum cambriense]
FKGSLEKMTEALTGRQKIETASGETITKDQVEAFNLVKRLEGEFSGLSSTVDRLRGTVSRASEAVKAKSRVVLNSEQVAASMSDRVTAAQSSILDDHCRGVRAELDEQAAAISAAMSEQRGQLAVLGREQVEAINEQTSKAVDSLRSAEAASMKASKIARFETGKAFAIAAVPTLLIVVVSVWVLSGVTQAMGLGPIFSALWGWFASVDAWYAKVGVAIVNLLILGGLIGGVLGAGYLYVKKIADL